MFWIRFESSVISYGSKAPIVDPPPQEKFESSVISYGSKAKDILLTERSKFESSVISYGSKAYLSKEAILL